MANKKRRIRLGVIFGGMSGEHEVSVSSAASLIGALDPDAFEVTAIGITKIGGLATHEEIRGMLPPALHARVRLQAGMAGSDKPMRSAGLFAPGADLETQPEIIFPLLHGPYGEDGTIQGLLEIAGIAYVGCGVLASAVGMDKEIMKRLFVQAALPVVPFHVERSRGLEQRVGALRHMLEQEFGYPMFSKPANLGSSVGVFKIHHAGEFESTVLASARYDRKIIVEKGIDARELECAVLGNDRPAASPVGEIFPAREFYDYQAKYVDPASRTQVPADIGREQAEEVRRLAVRAFTAIDGAGLARVDFFLDRKNGAVWLNEINTMPGFTSISMYPKLWAADGLSFNDLIRRLAELGMERHRERAEYTAAQTQPDAQQRQER